MSQDERHDEVESLLGAYALDAVSDDERVLVESHLEGCPRCRAEVDAFLEVAAALGNSVDPVPQALWDRIAGSLDLATPGDATLLEIRAKAREQIVDAGSRGTRGRTTAGARVDRWRRVAMAAVAAAAAVALALVSLSLSNANSTVGQLQALVAARGAGAAAQAALASPGHRLVQLRQPDGEQLATVVLTSGGTGYLVSTHLAPLPDSKTYQLWATIDSRPISLGLLGNRPARNAAFSMDNHASATALLLTVEPAHGVVRPTQAPIAAGAITT